MSDNIPMKDTAPTSPGWIDRVEEINAILEEVHRLAIPLVGMTMKRPEHPSDPSTYFEKMTCCLDELRSAAHAIRQQMQDIVSQF